MRKIHSIQINYDKGELIINDEVIKDTAIIGVADDSTENWLRKKVINGHNRAEKLIRVAVYYEEVHPMKEEPHLNRFANNKP